MTIELQLQILQTNNFKKYLSKKSCLYNNKEVSGILKSNVPNSEAKKVVTKSGKNFVATKIGAQNELKRKLIVSFFGRSSTI